MIPRNIDSPPLPSSPTHIQSQIPKIERRDGKDPNFVAIKVSNAPTNDGSKRNLGDSGESLSSEADDEIKLFRDYDFSKHNPEFYFFVKIFRQSSTGEELHEIEEKISGEELSESEESDGEELEYNFVDSKRNSFAKIKKTTSNFFSFLKKISKKSKSRNNISSESDSQVQEVENVSENRPRKISIKLESDNSSVIKMDEKNISDDALTGRSRKSSLSQLRKSISKSRSSKVASEIDIAGIWRPQVESCFKQLMKNYNLPDSDFKTVKKSENYHLGKIVAEKNPIILVRGKMRLNARPDQIFGLIYDLELRSEWEPVLLGFEMLECISSGIDIIYSKVKGQYGASGRDFVQLRGTYKAREGYDYVIVMKSIEHKTKPVVQKLVRANTIISGYLIKDIGNGRCELGIISQTDIKGRIPKFLVNYIAPKQPVKWLITLG